MTAPHDEELPQPHRRRHTPVILACGAAVAIAGGVAITAANASGASGAGALVATSGTTSAAAPSGAPTGAPSGAPTPRKHTPRLDGTVTSVSGTQILIKDWDGFTRTIVTSGATKYTDGLTRAAVKAGVAIHAEGTVDANGTSLDATSIGKHPTLPAGGPGGHGWGGPGGHGRPPGPPNGTRPTGPPPSGAPTAPSGSTHS